MLEARSENPALGKGPLLVAIAAGVCAVAYVLLRSGKTAAAAAAAKSRAVVGTPDKPPTAINCSTYPMCALLQSFAEAKGYFIYYSPHHPLEVTAWGPPGPLFLSYGESARAYGGYGFWKYAALSGVWAVDD